VYAPGEVAPALSESAYARSGPLMFLRACRPRSVMDTVSFPTIASRTAVLAAPQR
jgi:hypothetical protein